MWRRKADLLLGVLKAVALKRLLLTRFAFVDMPETNLMNITNPRGFTHFAPTLITSNPACHLRADSTSSNSAGPLFFMA